MHNEINVQINGGGVAGRLLLAAIRQLKPHINVQLLERQSSWNSAHTWCFHHADIPEGAWAWLGPLVTHRWSAYDVYFPKYHRRLSSPYYAISSESLAKLVLEKYSSHVHFNSVGDVAASESKIIVNAQGWSPPHGECGYQKFVGWDVELRDRHGLIAPVIKDVCVEQTDGYRFFYLLPWSENKVLVEDTYYSNSPALNVSEIEKEIQSYIEKKGWKIKFVVRKEQGCLPLPLYSLESSEGLSLGAASGLFNPVTGYTLPQTIRFIHEWVNLPVVTREEWSQISLRLRREYSSQFRFFRFLNRMMFKAAVPERRYQILQRFYKLPEGLISRFYSSQLTLSDQMRLLAGKPPVPWWRAVDQLFPMRK